MTNSTTSTSTPAGGGKQEEEQSISLSDRYNTAMSDLSSLGRVSHRLALIDNSERLQQVLSKLLPKLIQRIGDNHRNQNIQLTTTTTTTSSSNNNNNNTQQDNNELKTMIETTYNKIHFKLVEMLSHTMKRVRQDKSVQLPCISLLKLLLIEEEEEKQQNGSGLNLIIPKGNSKVNPFVLNLSLTFLMIGIPRCKSLIELQELLPGLIVWNGYYYNYFHTIAPTKNDTNNDTKQKTQYTQFSHLLLRTIEQLVVVQMGQNVMSGGGNKRFKPTTNSNDSTTTNDNNSSSSSNNNNNNNNNNNIILSSVDLARYICTNNIHDAGQALYELLLDVLLYQPTRGNIPPPGLSQFGNDKLQSGPSSNSNSNTSSSTTITPTLWSNEMAQRSRLVQFKLHILEMISPKKQWGGLLLFNDYHNNTTTTTTAPTATTTTTTIPQQQKQKDFSSLALARTIVLLLVASGDNTLQEVSQQASVYLKQQLDSIRTTTRSNSSSSSGTSNNDNNNNRSSNENGSNNNKNNFHHPIYGNPISLIYEVLTICVGATNADLTLSKLHQQLQLQQKQQYLGFNHQIFEQQQQQQQQQSVPQQQQQQKQQLILRHKRRMVSDMTYAALTNFVAKMFIDMPHILIQQPQKALSTTTSINVMIGTIGTLCVVACNKILSNLKTSTGLSMARGKKFIAAAQLLNSLVIRLSTISSSSSSTITSSSSDGTNDINGDIGTITISLLAKSLAIACQGISSISSSFNVRKSSSSTNTSTSATTSEGNIAVRDALYGVICALSRSPLLSLSSSSSFLWLFALGKHEPQQQNEQSSSEVSIETATLLFKCAANEEDRLRPRAVAALDALLAAYCRVYNNNAITNDTSKKQQKSVSSTSVDTAETSKTDNNVQKTQQEVSDEDMKESCESNMDISQPTVVPNPWSNITPTATSTSTTTTTKNEVEATNDAIATTSTTMQQQNLSKKSLSVALLPLLWSASQPSQPKASRVAAARWTSDLLKTIDLVNGCHLLCFLAGDSDGTAASISKEGLGLVAVEQVQAQKQNQSSTTNSSSSSSSTTTTTTTTSTTTTIQEADAVQVPDFGEFTRILFSSTSNSRAQFWDFSPLGKAICLRFCWNCLFHDLYGGENDAVELYIFALTKTLAELSSSVLRGGVDGGAISSHQREFVELLDDCSICLSSCLSTSFYARSLVLSSVDAMEIDNNINKRDIIPLGLEDIEKLALTVNSSRARRHLAQCCGFLYEDQLLWRKILNCRGDKDEEKYRQEWIQTMLRPMNICAKELDEFRLGTPSRSPVGKVHGASFLGATCVRAFRLDQAREAQKKANTNFDTSSTSSSLVPLQQAWDMACSILSALGGGTLHPDESIGNAFADGLAIALSYSSDDAPLADERLYGGITIALTQLATAIRKYGNSSENLQANNTTASSRTSKLAIAAGICLAASTSGAGSVLVSKTVTGAGTTTDGDATTVGENTGNNDADTNHTLILHKLGPARLECVESLFLLLGSTAFRKDEEIALIAGEALAWYADAYSPKDVVWSSQTAVWPDEFDERFAKGLPPHQQVVYTLLRRVNLTSNPHKRTSCAPALLAVVARAASRVNRDSSYASRSLVIELCNHLEEIQQAFIKLLADPKSKHLCHESCCLGLAACRGLTEISSATISSVNSLDGGTTKGTSSDEFNEKLLRVFGQTSNYGGSAMMETRAQAEARRRANAANNENNNPTTMGAAPLMEQFGEEAEVGGTASLGEAALGAYREMAGAAVSLGRPDVLYALFILSVSHSVWFTQESRIKYSAAALLGENSIIGSRTNASEMRGALRPHLGKLLPRMLRACHDPNKQTRGQMSNLWNGLTGGGAEARLAITEHLIPTLDALIEDATNKLWRARVGACGALCQIIVARSWQELGGGQAVLDDDDVISGTIPSSSAAGARLLRLWRVSMRSLDDVRGAVRDAGETLARGVRSLTIRLCDPSAMDNPTIGGIASDREIDRVQHERDASAASGTALRWLIKRGLNQPCPEATGVCVSCLVGIVDVVKPSILRPLIPELLRSLLFAMSGLEPAALSFLQTRAAGQDASTGSYDRLERLRLQLAQSGPLATAVSKCLAMLPYVDLETQKAVIPQLDAALRLSAGFASRAATADAVSTLCSTCPNAFRFTGPSSTNPSVRLLRALYFASERERGQGARDKMAHALGNIAALCPGGSVRSLAVRACERYSSSTGNNDDPGARRAAAVALRSIAVRASNQFSDGGSSDVWCRRILPVAYLGMKDADTKVASLWKEVWEEGGSTANLAGAADDFGSLLEEKLLPYLVKECVKALEDVSWSRRATGSVALGDLADSNILAPNPVNVLKSNNSLESERSMRRTQASSAALVSSVPLMAGTRLWSGKMEVVKATVKVATKWCARVDDETVATDGNSDCGTWNPVLVSPGQSENDLFVGDTWFLEDSTKMDIVEVETNESQDAMVVDEDNTEAKIDFDEGDKLLESENQTSASRDDEAALQEKSCVVTFSGLCRALLKQAFPTSSKSMLSVAEEEVLPYRAAVLVAFKDLMMALGDSQIANAQKQDIYRMLSPMLIAVFDKEGHFNVETKSKEEAPLIVARSIECLAACFWKGIGNKESLCSIPTSNILELARILQTTGGAGQGAWTVKEAATLGCASLALKSDSESLRSHVLISLLVDCVSQALKDRKFWRVRYAGLQLLHALVTRAGNPSDSSVSVSVSTLAVQQSPDAQEKQLLFEAMLPQKEIMLKLARQVLSDSEAKVTALSSDILSAISWWP